MICRGCETEITSEQQYCPSCGLKNEEAGSPKNSKKCMDCGKEFPEDRFFCDDCGGKLVPIAIQPAGGTMPTQNFTGQSYHQADQATHNQMPPNIPPLPSYIPGNKKKSKAKPIIITMVVFLVLVVGGYLILQVIEEFDSSDSSSYYDTDYSSNADNETSDTGTDDTATDVITDTTIDSSEDSSADISSDSGAVTEETAEGDTTANSDYNIVYSYYELPDVISIDADTRFSYVDYFAEDGIATYTYSFNDPSATVSDFYSAIDSYCILVQNLNSFIYEKEFSETQYQETGNLTTYMTKEDTSLSITADTQNGYYVYVSIVSLSEEEASADEIYFTNYMDYIVERDSKYFDLGTEVVMENGVSFYLYDISATNLGDGTQSLDVNIDLASYYSGYYLYSDDFMIVPMDAAGNILSDAVIATTITDSQGYYTTTPILLDTQYYYNYKMSFLVPAETKIFTIYGTNKLNGEPAGPVYNIEMTINEY